MEIVGWTDIAAKSSMNLNFSFDRGTKSILIASSELYARKMR
jgi:hypothetical protein